METYKNMHGFDMDSTIAHIVNDLVQIGDDASGANAHGGADRQSLAYLFGAILILLLFFQPLLLFSKHIAPCEGFFIVFFYNAPKIFDH